MSADKLYQAVRSGQIGLDQLNDEGKQALHDYMLQNHPESLIQAQNNTDSQQMQQADRIGIAETAMKPSSFMNSPMFQPQPKIDSPEQMDNANSQAIRDISLAQPQTFGDKIFQDNPIARAINAPFKYMAQAAASGPYLNGQTDELGFRSLGERMAYQDPAATGNKTYDKAAQTLGNLAAPFVPMMGGPMGGFSEIPLVQRLAGDVGGKLGGGALGKLAESAMTGVAEGVPQNIAGEMAINPNANAKDLAIAGATGAALGGGLGVAGKAAGMGISKLAQKYAGTKLGDAIGRFFNRTEPAPEVQPQQPLALPAAGETYGAKRLMLREGTIPSGEPIHMPGDIYQPPILELPQGNYTPPTRMRVKNPDEAFQSVYEKVLPVAKERMTPPLENPNELAKWVQKAFSDAGHDVSLNEVRTLPYEDLRQLSEEIQGRMKPFDVVRQTAHDMGYGKIFDGTAPTLQQRLVQDAQKAVYGVPVGRVNIEQPKFNIVHENDAASPETAFKIKRPIKSSMSEAPKSETPKMEQPKVETKPQEQILKSESIPEQPIELPKEPRLRDQIVNFMDDKAAEARARLKAKRNTLSSNPADQWADYAIIGASHMVKGVVKLADFTEAMVKEFGDGIRAHVPELYKRSREIAGISAKMSESEIRRLRNVEKFAWNNADETIPDTRSHIATKTKGESTTTMQKANKTYIKSVDNIIRLNQMGKDFEKASGEQLAPRENAYMLGLNSRNNDMIANRIISDHMLDAQGNVIGSSLKEVLKPIKRREYQDFTDYLINKHAVTRMNRGEDVFPDNMKMSPEKSSKIAAMYEEKYPKFKEVAQGIYHFNQQLGEEWLVKTGIISRDAWETYLKENPYYVPNNRLFSDLEKPGFKLGKGGFASQTNPIKAAPGSKRKIIDPIESIIEHVAQYVKTAKQNEVMQSVVKYLEKEPEALQGWAEIVGREKSNADELLKQDGVEGVINEINQPFEMAKQKPDLTKGNIVFATVDGEKVHLKVNDPQLLEAISNLPRGAQHPIVALFGTITRIMKNLTTGINPVFSLTRNIFRDIPESYKNSKTTNNPGKFAWDLFHAIGSVIGHGKLYESYKDMGGGHSSPIASNRNMLARSKNSVIPAQNTVQAFVKGVQRVYHLLENFNNAIETAPRLAEYKRIAKNGDYDSKIKGLYEANDVTVNFNRYGNFSKDLDAFFPYFNAAVQGLDKFIRSYKDNPIAATIKSVAAMTIPTMLLYFHNENDPNYQKLSNYTKDNFFCIPKGDGTFFKIPKPREAGFLFSTLIERILRDQRDHDPKAYQDLRRAFINTFMPPGAQALAQGISEGGSITEMNPFNDSVMGPMLDLAGNKDFAGRTIVPQDLQKLSPSQQYDQNTSEISKKLGGIINQSPKQLDYLLKSYGGVLGQIGIPATAKGSTVSDTLNKLVTADPVYSNDIMNTFYSNKAKYDTAEADYKAKGVQSPDFNPAMRQVYDKVGQTIAVIRKQIGATQNNPNLSPDDKQQLIRSMQDKMNQIASQVNAAVQRR